MTSCAKVAQTNKTGKKEKDPGKKSTRAKSFKEDRHPRKKGSGKKGPKGRKKGKGTPGGGQFTSTSAASKKKHGKGGTTKRKQIAACKGRAKRRG